MTSIVTSLDDEHKKCSKSYENKYKNYHYCSVCVSGEGEPKTAMLTLLPDSATNAPNKFINMYMRAYD